MRTEEVNVDVAGLAVAGKFKVVMFQVREAVAHILFPGLDYLPPDCLSFALNTCFSGDCAEWSADDELRSDAACAQLRAGEVEVVALFKLMVGEFIACG